MISNVDPAMLRGMKSGAVVDLRDQLVETSFCSLKEERVSILYDVDECQQPATQSARRSTTNQPARRSSTSQSTSRSTSSQPVEITSTTTQTSQHTATSSPATTPGSSMQKSTPKRRPMAQILPNTTSTDNQTTPMGNSTTVTQVSTTSDQAREYVYIFVIIVSVSVGVFVIIVIICYCNSFFVETHCKCCLKNTARNRRFSGESIELFSHQIPESLPNLRYRVKDM